MLVYFFKLLILIWLFFLQNVYADIKIIDGDTIIFNEKKFDFLVLMPQKLINIVLTKKKSNIAVV